VCRSVTTTPSTTPSADNGDVEPTTGIGGKCTVDLRQARVRRLVTTTPGHIQFKPCGDELLGRTRSVQSLGCGLRPAPGWRAGHGRERAQGTAPVC